MAPNGLGADIYGFGYFLSRGFIIFLRDIAKYSLCWIDAGKCSLSPSVLIIYFIITCITYHLLKQLYCCFIFSVTNF